MLLTRRDFQSSKWLKISSKVILVPGNAKIAPAYVIESLIDSTTVLVQSLILGLALNLYNKKMITLH